MSNKLSAAEIKAQCEALWNKPGVICADSYISWDISDNQQYIRWTKRTLTPMIMSKEQKARRNKLAMYSPKLKDAILAEADMTVKEMSIPVLGKYGNKEVDKNGKVKMQTVKLPFYTFTQQPKTESPVIEASPVSKPANKPVKRLTQRKIDAAAAILAKLDRNQWAAFFARFGVKLDIAEKIAANDNLNQAAREFLKAALAA
jgi:hypothetical protein